MAILLMYPYIIYVYNIIYIYICYFIEHGRPKFAKPFERKLLKTFRNKEMQDKLGVHFCKKKVQMIALQGKKKKKGSSLMEDELAWAMK